MVVLVVIEGKARKGGVGKARETEKGKAGESSGGSRSSSGGVWGKAEVPRVDTSPYGDDIPTIAEKLHTPPLIPHPPGYPAVPSGRLLESGGKQGMKGKPNGGRKGWEPATGRIPPMQT